MARLKLTLSYCGGMYAGWQIQAENRKTNTVQQELERALETIAGNPVRVHGAGRTDSGVHAEGQVAHADVPEKTVDWRRALNALLPRDIRVLAAEPVAAAFHARYAATGKLYAYTVFSGQKPLPPRLESFAWATPPLDLAAMEAVAAILAGRHDFASFQNAGTPIADTVREVWSIRREEGRAGPFLCPEGWPVTTWFFHGNGFLKQMIRNMMGLMVWAGQGRLDAAAAAACLAAKSRQAVPSPTAPAKGLTLMRVDYDGTMPAAFSLL